MGGSVGKFFSDNRGFLADPTGLLGEGFAKHLADPLDLTGVAATEQAREAEKAAAVEKAKQDAIIAKQEAAVAKQKAIVDKRREEQEASANERKTRMKQNQLLSGGETGVTTLLGAKA